MLSYELGIQQFGGLVCLICHLIQ